MVLRSWLNIRINNSSPQYHCAQPCSLSSIIYGSLFLSPFTCPQFFIYSKPFRLWSEKIEQPSGSNSLSTWTCANQETFNYHTTLTQTLTPTLEYTHTFVFLSCTFSRIFCKTDTHTGWERRTEGYEASSSIASLHCSSECIFGYSRSLGFALRNHMISLSRPETGEKALEKMFAIGGKQNWCN